MNSALHSLGVTPPLDSALKLNQSSLEENASGLKDPIILEEHESDYKMLSDSG